MHLSDFYVGGAFLSSSGLRWRCTDKGAHTVVAIQLEHEEDPSTQYAGPPYAVAEEAFDEAGQGVCSPDPAHDEAQGPDTASVCCAEAPSSPPELAEWRGPFTGAVRLVPPRVGGMRLEDFTLGDTFFMSGAAWLCVDKGTRVVLARRVRDGYESVLDEHDQEACSREGEGEGEGDSSDEGNSGDSCASSLC